MSNVQEPRRSTCTSMTGTWEILSSPCGAEASVHVMRLASCSVCCASASPTPPVRDRQLVTFKYSTRSRHTSTVAHATAPWQSTPSPPSGPQESKGSRDTAQWQMKSVHQCSRQCKKPQEKGGERKCGLENCQKCNRLDRYAARQCQRFCTGLTSQSGPFDKTTDTHAVSKLFPLLVTFLPSFLAPGGGLAVSIVFEQSRPENFVRVLAARRTTKAHDSVNKTHASNKLKSVDLTHHTSMFGRAIGSERGFGWTGRSGKSGAVRSE